MPATRPFASRLENFVHRHPPVLKNDGRPNGIEGVAGNDQPLQADLRAGVEQAENAERQFIPGKQVGRPGFPRRLFSARASGGCRCNLIQVDQHRVDAADNIRKGAGQVSLDRHLQPALAKPHFGSRRIFRDAPEQVAEPAQHSLRRRGNAVVGAAGFESDGAVESRRPRAGFLDPDLADQAAAAIAKCDDRIGNLQLPDERDGRLCGSNLVAALSRCLAGCRTALLPEEPVCCALLVRLQQQVGTGQAEMHNLDRAADQREQRDFDFRALRRHHLGPGTPDGIGKRDVGHRDRRRQGQDTLFDPAGDPDLAAGRVLQRSGNLVAVGRKVRRADGDDCADDDQDAQTRQADRTAQKPAHRLPPYFGGLYI